MLDKTKRDWWKSAVFYQIYPKSFQDANGDGVGDLRGIIGRLDYLEKLGVDGIWLSPVYASPHRDNGYDISDYRAVHPLFGTMADMDELIAEADRRGLTIIMDLVLNHSSDQHPWFLSAKSGRESPCHDYYIWWDGTPDCPPNGTRAVFGGSAWTYVPEIGQYYYNQFSPWQPDLNWENPALRRELYDMIRFWVDKGVGGFRLDAIDKMGKEPDREGLFCSHPRLHQYMREMRREAFREDTLVTVGEAWGTGVEEAMLYANADGSELSMIFQFEHTFLDQVDKWGRIPLPLVKLKRCYEQWQHGLAGRGWNSLFLNNHDLPRIVSRWGDDGAYRVESAKMLAMMCHGMQGTPYIYQGEELGMTNIRLSIEEYDDLEIKNHYQEELAKGRTPEEIMPSIYTWGRDNARTPMQWTGGDWAGFSTAKPWLPVNPSYSAINAEAALADPDSIFYFYQKLIALRKQLPVFREGSFTLLCPEDGKCFAYTRDTADEHLLVVCNFTAETLPECCPEAFCGAEVLLANYQDPSGPLRPYEARMLRRKGT